jgi:hypothetical protein
MMIAQNSSLRYFHMGRLLRDAFFRLLPSRIEGPLSCRADAISCDGGHNAHHENADTMKRLRSFLPRGSVSLNQVHRTHILPPASRKTASTVILGPPDFNFTTLPAFDLVRHDFSSPSLPTATLSERRGFWNPSRLGSITPNASCLGKLTAPLAPKDVGGPGSRRPGPFPIRGCARRRPWTK